MVEAVNFQPLSTVAGVRDRVSTCGLRGGQSRTGRGFSQNSPNIFNLFL
jgi:hypothetical protein